MLALALSASAAPQDTALTPSGTDARVSWADHPETTLRSQRSRGDLAPAAKSHNTGQVVDFAAVPTDVPSTPGAGGSGPDNTLGATYMCTDIDFEDSLLSVHNFGGADYCCTVCNGNTQICCPSKDADGNDIIVTVEHDEAAYKFNLCEPDVTESFFRLDNIQTVDGMDKIAMISKNLTEYSPVWPVQGGNMGYLNNGRKVGKTAASELMQLNLCANRVLALETCFVDATTADTAVALSTAAVRFFDLDHGKDPDMGPEVIQFKCPGGTFTLYGNEQEDEDDVEFLVHMNNASKALERPRSGEMTVNGLPVNVYDCPADGWVTLWSSRAGVAKDNPTQAEIPLDPNLGPLQELSMIQVNFTNVDCFQVNFATRP